MKKINVLLFTIIIVVSTLSAQTYQENKTKVIETLEAIINTLNAANKDIATVNFLLTKTNGQIGINIEIFNVAMNRVENATSILQNIQEKIDGITNERFTHFSDEEKQKVLILSSLINQQIEMLKHKIEILHSNTSKIYKIENKIRDAITGENKSESSSPQPNTFFSKINNLYFLSLRIKLI
jgi:hypothetical protein